MTQPCPKCPHDNLPRAIYCEQCGADLAAQPQTELRIGREPDNDLVLDFPMVSGHQAVLRVSGGTMEIEDLGSTNGTYLNQSENRIQKAKLKDSDFLYFGTYRISVNRILRNPKTSSDGDRFFPFVDGNLTIGRDPSSHIHLEHPLVSWNHARIVAKHGRMVLQDNGSTNGTILNGVQVRGHTALSPGDRILVGHFLCDLEQKGVWLKNSWQRFTLDVRRASVLVNYRDDSKRKVLLNDISLVVYPGELCGLMGLAGAGKSTLLKAANGYLQPTIGAIYINGANLHQNYDTFRTAIGYVPQEDIFHKELTVGQALSFAAQLRLEGDLGSTELNNLINKILDRLHMFDTNRQISDTPISQISGGQKRRLNIAIELLADPAIFFLDEPTSGLSSEDALTVMELLREMAQDGKTIIFSLHQPSMEIYQLMDNVIYLHKGGNLAYYGPTVPDSFTFANPDMPPNQATENPETVLRALEKQPANYWRKTYRNSAYCKEFVIDRQKNRPLDGNQQKASPVSFTGMLAQWWILHRRNTTIKLQDRMNSAILLSQSPVIAGLIALVFSGSEEDAYQGAPTSLFLMVIAAIWFGCSNAARDICGEWIIYQRERMYNLNIVPFVAAKFSVAALVCAVQCFVLVVVVTLFCHLKASFFQILGQLWLTSLAGVSLGLFISAFASPFKKSNEIAVGLIPIVLLPMIILGGIIKPYKDMDPASKALAAAMITHWSFQGVLVLEAEAQTDEVVFKSLEGDVSKHKRDLILDQFFDEDTEGSPRESAIMVSLICLFFLLINMAYLRTKDLV